MILRWRPELKRIPFLYQEVRGYVSPSMAFEAEKKDRRVDERTAVQPARKGPQRTETTPFATCRFHCRPSNFDDGASGEAKNGKVSRKNNPSTRL